jgi:four helix bundle protein
LVLGPWVKAIGGGGIVATKRFEELRVYRIAETLGDEVWEIVRAWDGLARDTVGKQIVRSADSIGANLAEGTGRGSFQDNRRFVRMARGSLYETRHWLRRAYKRKLLSTDQIDRLRPLISNLAPMLNAYLKSIGPSSKSSRPELRANDQ